MASTNQPQFVFGNDPPADSATQGYRLNHVALVVNNLKAARQFYGDILGMREIFTCEPTADFTIVYMGYPSPGTHATGQLLWDERKNRSGLLELLHMRGSQVQRTQGRQGTFSHLGLIVPDVQAVRDRMKDHGVKILKDVGDGNMPLGAIGDAMGGVGDDQKIQKASAVMSGMGFDKILLVADPDGNIVEILD